ncbi:MAG TPA: tRNA (adenosine(37)-N6)-threonylcarbamoyltransferase complex transferase subunit TsaD [Acidimicrobiales bacterium]|nr:tRNA (adenosine(37)-N6)-threonylcarbamoyltransferase complex transferase subunit TsaD [Acidimicrobiales bacterium]
MSAAGPGPGPGCLVLALETSCDETAAAVVADGREVLSSVVSSQVDLHARYGGVVPEVAGRAHLERILAVLEEALEGAGLPLPGHRSPGAALGGPAGAIGAVAATVGPGLVGALLVGISAAKSLALAWGVPFVGVNHLEGHLYASLLEEPGLELPAAVLLASGGHTLLVEMDGPGSYRLLGGTVDDAAGEAFDKVARYLGLGYPGGPAIERAALEGDAAAIAFTRPMLERGLDVSFSGLKTAVVHHVRAHPEVPTPDVAASFQAAVVDVLVHKALAAARLVRARSVCLAGGVAANASLRERLADACALEGLHVFLPSRAMCTDNAAMIGAAAYFRLRSDGPTPLGAGAEPTMGFPPAS